MFDAFFARWRAFSNRVVQALVVACGAISISGALQVRRMNGPSWAIVAFSLAGIALIIAAYARPRRRKSAKL
jgi:hypothetical protein